MFLNIILFICVVATGQQPNSFYDDTITIDEVRIQGNGKRKGPAGFRDYEIDSAAIHNYGHMSISEILQWNSPVAIKNYGPGGIATPTFRGTSASNTIVTWNGINISNPMVGQADLSLLPSGVVDELHIYQGAAAIESESGSTGGTIALETKPVWGRNNTLSITSSAGSLNDYSGQVSFRSGTENFHSVTRAYGSSALNNFTYINRVYSSEPFTAVRKHNESNRYGFIQELYLRKSGNEISLRFWYQTSLRNLPASLLVYPDNNGGEQSDEHSRIIINFKNQNGLVKYFITGAYMHAGLNYFNSVSSIDSRNLSDNIILKAGTSFNIGLYSSLNLLLNEEFCSVNSNNYPDLARRHVGMISANLLSRNSGNISGNILLKQILFNNKFLRPDLSAGIEFTPGSGNMSLKGNISKSSRIPGMNDLYWFPGGNPELKNEYSLISELIFETDNNISESIDLNASISLYNNNIVNMIRWVPGESSLWKAENTGRAKSYGVETSIKSSIKTGRITATMMAGYNYTRAYEINDAFTGNKQLSYIPVSQANATLSFQYKLIAASWRSLLCGRRYTDANNAKFLKPYFINSLTLSLGQKPSWGLINLAVDVDNLFNAEYQTMAFYPLPGRLYQLRVNIQIIKDKK